MNALLGKHNLLKLKERINCINMFPYIVFFYSVKKVMTPEAAQLSISGCVCIHVCS